MKNPIHIKAVFQALWYYVNKETLTSEEEAVFLSLIVNILKEKDIPVVAFIDIWDEMEAVLHVFEKETNEDPRLKK